MSTAERLVTKTQQQLSAIPDTVGRIQGTLSSILKALFYGRLGISALLLSWVIFISYKLTKQSEEEEESEEGRDRYFYLHRVWFGEESILMILFNMWYYSVILLMLTPIISWLADILKLYLAGGRLLG